VETKQAPYAPPSAVLKVIRHYADRDVPERVTLVNLVQIGVTEALAPRTYVALKFLGLLEEDGTTTGQFRALRYAKSDEYQEVFGAVLDAAYKDIINHVDIGEATDTDIANAFRPYSPCGQRNRMITLFVALAREAGWELHNVGPVVSSTPKPRSRPKPKATSQGKGQPSPNAVENAEARRESPLPTQQGVLFGVTEADLAALPETEFDTVWSALGLVARARARSLKALADMDQQASKRRATEDEPEGK
jgi:hypothetical protein